MERPLNILHLEDNLSDAELIHAMIREEGLKFNMLRVDTRQEFEEALCNERYDIVLSDYSLPSYSGNEALEFTRKKQPDCNFIYVSGALGEEAAIEALTRGATDYVLKNRLKRLIPAIRRAVEESSIRNRHRESLKALEESEKQLKLALEATGAGIWNMHAGDMKFFWSPSWLKRLGYNLSEDWESYEFWKSGIHPEDLPSVIEAMERHLGGTSASVEAEYRCLRKSGGYLWVLLHGKIVERDQFQQPVMVSGTIIDISRRKAIENELILARDKAEKSSLVKSSLLANMSHELRTPMNGILGFAEILKDEVTDPTQSAWLKNILESGNRLMGTLSAILDIVELDSSLEVHKFQDVDIVMKARSVLALYETKAIGKGLYIRLEEPGHPVMARVVDRFIQQLISLLVDNAVKFTEQGGITLSIDELTKEGQPWCVLHVKDTGIGISWKNHEVIFEEFRQVSEGFNRDYEGNGLGLTLAKKMAEGMNGRITMESELGKGSVFTLWLPSSPMVTEVTRGEAPGTASGLVVSPQPSPPAGQKRYNLLLVEDNLANIQITLIFLKSFCHVDYARNGRNALEMAKANTYDGFLIDINLGPGMDGHQVCSELKLMPQYASAPMIAVTGYTMWSEQQRFSEEGFTGYLAKPFSREALRTTIRDAFTEKKTL